MLCLFLDVYGISGGGGTDIGIVVLPIITPVLVRGAVDVALTFWDRASKKKGLEFCQGINFESVSSSNEARGRQTNIHSSLLNTLPFRPTVTSPVVTLCEVPALTCFDAGSAIILVMFAALLLDMSSGMQRVTATKSSEELAQEPTRT